MNKSAVKVCAYAAKGNETKKKRKKKASTGSASFLFI